MSLLSVKGISVRYTVAGRVKAAMSGMASRHVDAVIDVSFDIPAGSTLAVVGESGSGKTSLARAIMGLTRFKSGAIRFDGSNPFAAGRPGKAHARDVAMIFQDPVSSLSPRRSVGALITEPLVIHGAAGDDLGAEARRLLGLVGLPADFAERYPHQLSGGQARRVGVARAIALNPRLIIADEPTAGLDVSVQGEVLNLLARLQAERGLTYLVITHNLAVVRHLSDRTAIMYMGRIVEQGPTARIFAFPGHPYTAALIAAQPNPEPGGPLRPPAIRGEVTSLLARPSGCEFHPRCPHASDLCRSTAPPDAAVSDSHNLRCHHPLQ